MWESTSASLTAPGATVGRPYPGWPACLEPVELETLDGPTPFLALSLGTVASQLIALRRALPTLEVAYAVKCNPDAGVLRTLASLGASFEIASAAELALVQAAGGNPERVVYANPVKPARHVAATYAAGVHCFVVDGPAEVDKVARHAPGSQVLIRALVDDRSSAFPLSAKFGAPVPDLIPLLERARRFGLIPAGLTFHVGSQCPSPTAWGQAIRSLAAPLQAMQDLGMRALVLDIGGGFPARYEPPVAGFADLAGPTIEALDWLRSRGLLPERLLCEPGRALVAEAGVMATTVLGRETRADGEWLFVDCGAYNGLMEAAQTQGRWPFPMRLGPGHDGGTLNTFTVTGPTCDSSDTLRHAVTLPDSVREGDRLYIGGAGAYSLVYGSAFNGFDVPEALYV